MSARDGAGLRREQGVGDKDHARGTEPALHAMRFAERVLDDAEFARCGCERLHGRDLVTIGLHRKYQAGARRLAVDQHRAGTANAVLSAGVDPVEIESVAQAVDQRGARLDVQRLAVAPLTSSSTFMRASAASSRASAIARRPARGTRRGSRRPACGLPRFLARRAAAPVSRTPLRPARSDQRLGHRIEPHRHGGRATDAERQARQRPALSSATCAAAETTEVAAARADLLEADTDRGRRARPESGPR